MELSLITPIAHLEYTSLLPGRFCIATVAAKSPAYLDYFIEAQAAGYKVILDNGVFESDIIDAGMYIEIAKAIQPAVLIVPDRIGVAAHANWEAAMVFVEKWRTVCMQDVILQSTELMFVPQCNLHSVGSLETILRKTIEVASPFKWIGICRDAVYNAFGQFTHTTDQEMNRFYFSAWLEEKGLLELALTANKKFHFLGLGNKIGMIKYHWYVESMDTACLFL